MLFCYIASLFALSQLPLRAALILLLAGVLAAAAYAYARRQWKTAFWVLGIVAAAAQFFVYTALVYTPAADLADERHTYVAEISDLPYEGDGFRIEQVRLIEADGEKIFGGPKAGLFYEGDKPLQIGDRVIFTATLKLYETPIVGFDSYAYNRAKGLYLRGSIKDGALTVEQPQRRPLYYHLRAANRSARAGLARYLDGETLGLASGVLLGDKQGLRDATILSFRRAGLSHIMAVSGMHMAFLVSLLTALLGALRLGPRKKAVLVSVGVIAFMLLTGCTPSATRSALMVLIAQGAVLCYREADTLTSLAAAVAAILVVNPYAAGDVGLQLSFTATLGIVLWATRLSGVFRRPIERSRLPKPAVRLLGGAAAVVATSLSATAATVPVLAVQFGTISLAAPLSNLLVVFAVSVLFFLSIILAAVSPVAFLGRLVALPVTEVANYILTVTKAVAKLPFASIDVHWAWFWLALAGIAVLTGGYFWFRSRESKTRRKSAGRVRFYPVLIAGALLVVIGYGTAPAGVASPELPAAKSDILTYAMVNVGQGDATLLARDGRAVLLDCGSDDWSMPSEQVDAYLRAAGIHSVDAAVLTHFHKDHANGLDEMIELYRIPVVYLPYLAPGNSYYEDIAASAQAVGCELRVVEQDMSVTLWDDLVLTIYADQIDRDDENSGLVILADYHDSEILITGDAEQGDERALVDLGAALDADVIKVGHHGSNTSSTAEFLMEVTPSIALISVGPDNSYGHPHEEVLARYGRFADALYRTDEQGDITLMTAGDGVFAVALGGN
nr:DNA internalization-related competence protein ComEC/Rec2 [Feifania hominis]